MSIVNKMRIPRMKKMAQIQFCVNEAEEYETGKSGKQHDHYDEYTNAIIKPCISYCFCYFSFHSIPIHIIQCPFGGASFSTRNRAHIHREINSTACK